MRAKSQILDKQKPRYKQEMRNQQWFENKMPAKYIQTKTLMSSKMQQTEKKNWNQLIRFRNEKKRKMSLIIRTDRWRDSKERQKHARVKYTLKIAQKIHIHYVSLTFLFVLNSSSFLDSRTNFTCRFVWITNAIYLEINKEIYLVEDCHCLDAYHRHLVPLDLLILMHIN